MTDNFKKKLLKEFQKIPSLQNLTPEKDWNLIWVLSAREIDINETSDGQRNETKDRLETGINLAKEITILRAGNQKLTIQKIKRHGPKIYYSGYNDHNRLMRKYKKNKFFENQYNFPSQNILVGPQENILHTDHQFQKMPQKLISENKKIVIVTGAYHIPRCQRYLSKYPQKFLTSQFIFYPSQPLDLDNKLVNLEIKKIINYTKEGIFASNLK